MSKTCRHIHTVLNSSNPHNSKGMGMPTKQRQKVYKTNAKISDNTTDILADKASKPRSPTNILERWNYESDISEVIENKNVLSGTGVDSRSLKIRFIK